MAMLLRRAIEQGALSTQEVSELNAAVFTLVELHLLMNRRLQRGLCQATPLPGSYLH